MSRRVEVKPGDRYGRLTMMREADPPRAGRYPRRRVECQCNCGSVIVADLASVRFGNTKSCGCLRNESTVERFTTHGHAGESRKSAEYVTYRSMIDRATRPGNKCFAIYGGAGRGVCDRWRDSFENFLVDVGPRPSPKHSIDRIDSERGYEPGNVRWATSRQQAENTSRSRWWTTPLGRFPSSVAAGRAHGVSLDTIRGRCGLKEPEKAKPGYSCEWKYPDTHAA